MDRTNDFAFKIATPNGTGSASANGLLMQAIFRMGVPVTGKNVFPSNIQGLPTWYEIRVSRQRLHRTDADFRPDGRPQSGDVSEGHRGGPLRRMAALRFDVAARHTPHAAGRHVHRDPLQRAVQHAFSRRARADPHEEHRVRRRAGGSARHRRRRASRDAQGEVLAGSRRSSTRIRRRWTSGAITPRRTSRARCPSASCRWTRRRTRS